MASYIKVNKKVVDYLNLTATRRQFPDGNYMLWQNDMLVFGPLYNLAALVAKVGGVILSPTAARKEQDGITVTPLPTATDDRFKTDEELAAIAEAEAAALEAETEGSAEAELAAEETAEDTEGQTTNEEEE